MEQAGDAAISVVQIILVALLGAGSTGGGWLAFHIKRKADRARVDRDTEVAAKQYQRDILRELRVMGDYAGTLRSYIRELGYSPPPWPDKLQHLP